MNISEQLKNNKFLIFAFIFALLNLGLIFSIFGSRTYADTPEWIETIHWLQGEETQVWPHRISRPLGLLLALPFEFLGEGAGLIVQNIIFYLLCTFLIFKITELIYHNKKQALFASLFFVTATSVIEVGLAYSTDAGAWFFYLLSIFLTLLYLKNKNEKLIILNGFLSGVGFLMKENGALGILFFGMIILLSKELNIKKKIFKIIRFGIFFLIPITLLQFFTYQYFNFTSLDFYLLHFTEDVRGTEGLLLRSLKYFGQLFRTLGILWIFFFIGLWREWQEKNPERIKIFLALVPFSFSFLIWPTSSGRFAFIFAPLGILLATRGLVFLDNKLGKKRGALMIILLLSVVLILNYCFVWLNPMFLFADIIADFLGIL